MDLLHVIVGAAGGAAAMAGWAAWRLKGSSDWTGSLARIFGGGGPTPIVPDK